MVDNPNATLGIGHQGLDLVGGGLGLGTLEQVLIPESHFLFKLSKPVV